ncbi:unknown similar to AMEV023 [Choristoneura biennis entomopoxvirus]|uniref:Uncharacterized protein n=1 Tax=Choristoneura biennis entomopoxvirus TaxID=10288 RepID=A0A916KPI5_CBEPV|nr:unknown similar to AMEV023 [Choristoneura biennis entomopoxvirus]CCU55698.1 unknown similar to AMEV023 [Choristoneura biennis entomopoxvirus]
MRGITFKNIVDNTIKWFQSNDNLIDLSLLISIIINELCVEYSLQCKIIHKYFKQGNKYFHYFLVSDGHTIYDTTLVNEENIFDTIDYNNLSDEEKMYEDILLNEYLSYVKNGIVDTNIYYYFDEIIKIIER